MGVTLRTIRDLPQFFCGVVGRGKCNFLWWDLNIKHCFSEMKYFCSLDNSTDDCLGPKLGILFKGGRNLRFNQDQPLKNFVSEFTVRLGILILDMDNEKKRNSHVVVTSTLRVQFVSCWRLRKLSSWHYSALADEWKECQGLQSNGIVQEESDLEYFSAVVCLEGS